MADMFEKLLADGDRLSTHIDQQRAKMTAHPETTVHEDVVALSRYLKESLDEWEESRNDLDCLQDFCEQYERELERKPNQRELGAFSAVKMIALVASILRNANLKANLIRGKTQPPEISED